MSPSHSMLEAFRTTAAANAPAGVPGSIEAPYVSSALSGKLTAREREILAQIASGQSNKTIARLLGISPDTVKLHVRHIMAKLGCRSRVAAAVLAVQHGLAGERV